MSKQSSRHQIWQAHVEVWARCGVDHEFLDLYHDLHGECCTDVRAAGIDNKFLMGKH